MSWTRGGLSLESNHELGAALRLSRWRWHGARRGETEAATHRRWEVSWVERGHVGYRIGRGRVLELAPRQLLSPPP